MTQRLSLPEVAPVPITDPRYSTARTRRRDIAPLLRLRHYAAMVLQRPLTWLLILDERLEAEPVAERTVEEQRQYERHGSR